jgi:hypothetical protein
VNKELFEAILNACKENNIKIIKPYRIEEGGRVGADADFQLNIMKDHYKEKYSVNSGFGGDVERSLTKADTFKEFIELLIEKSKNKDLQFVQLVMPRRAVEFAEMIDTQDVLIRHIIDYLPMSDILIDRWDILIKLHNKVS